MSINLEEDKCTFAFNLSRRHEKVICFYDKQCLSKNYLDYLEFTFEYDDIIKILNPDSIEFGSNTNQFFIHQQLK